MSLRGDKRAGKRIKNERTISGGNYLLETLFDRFYHAKISEGRTEKTLQSYRENFRYFCNYLDDNGIVKDMRNITPEVIRSYIAWMLREKVRYEECGKFAPKRDTAVGLSPTTVNVRLKGLRTMYRFLMDEGLIDRNPFDNVKKVEEPTKIITVMTAEQLKLLLGAPNQRTYAGFRDHVLITLLIDGFMRIGAACSIKKSDIDFELGLLKLRADSSKSRRDNVIPLQKETLKLLKDLLKENEDFDSDYVFLANYGERLTENNVRHRIKQYAGKVGLELNVHPHLFRHTSATMFLENGGDIRHLASILGHTDLRMVMRYTHLSTRSVKNQHDQYSPLNNLVGKLNKSRKIMR